MKEGEPRAGLNSAHWTWKARCVRNARATSPSFGLQQELSEAYAGFDCSILRRALTPLKYGMSL
jgi:hypothetical protein